MSEHLLLDEDDDGDEDGDEGEGEDGTRDTHAIQTGTPPSQHQRRKAHSQAEDALLSTAWSEDAPPRAEPSTASATWPAFAERVCALLRIVVASSGEEA